MSSAVLGGGEYLSESSCERDSKALPLPSNPSLSPHPHIPVLQHCDETRTKLDAARQREQSPVIKPSEWVSVHNSICVLFLSSAHVRYHSFVSESQYSVRYAP